MFFSNALNINGVRYERAGCKELTLKDWVHVLGNISIVIWLSCYPDQDFPEEFEEIDEEPVGLCIPVLYPIERYKAWDDLDHLNDLDLYPHTLKLYEFFEDKVICAVNLEVVESEEEEEIGSGAYIVINLKLNGTWEYPEFKKLVEEFERKEGGMNDGH